MLDTGKYLAFLRMRITQILPTSLYSLSAARSLEGSRGRPVAYMSVTKMLATSRASSSINSSNRSSNDRSRRDSFTWNRNQEGFVKKKLCKVKVVYKGVACTTCNATQGHSIKMWTSQYSNISSLFFQLWAYICKTYVNI